MNTVADLLRRRAAVDPDSVALVVDGGATLTMGEWDFRSDAAAGGLTARGIRAGDRVALLFDNARWTEFAVSYAAVHKAGATAVPLGPRFAGPELASVLDHCGATALVAPPDLVPPGQVSPPVIDPADLSVGGAHERVSVPLDATDIADILYTSGTTGRPKGVSCTHENVLFGVDPAGAKPDTPVPVDAAVVHAFPLGTNAGQEAVRLPLRQPGHAAVVLATFDPERLCALLAERPFPRLHLFLVPAMAQMILDSGAWERHDLGAVEHLLLTSAPTPPALLAPLAAAFAHSRISNVYTLTESGPARTVMVYDESRPGSVGRPARQAEVRVVDNDGSDLAVGSTGEIWLRRAGVPRREYFRDPEATERMFSGDWLRTGDLGYLDGDGYLYLVDRMDDMIISGGNNVSSLEVENVVGEHPAVSQVAVVGVPHAVLGQQVAAAVVARSPVTARDLQCFVRERLAEYKTPHAVTFVEALPRNDSGKVLKGELRETLATKGGAKPATAPRTKVEAAIAGIWKEVLRINEVGVDDDFFDSGGHSLAAAQVVSRMEEAFDVKLDLTTVFEAPTVAELAAVVEGAR